STKGQVLVGGLVAIPVLRAGLGLLDAVTDLYPWTVVGYLGMERDELTLEPRDYYAKLPPMSGCVALVLDAMLATGGSGSAARAAGVTFPTNPAMATIVTTYGIIRTNSSGRRRITGASFSQYGIAWANPNSIAAAINRLGFQFDRIRAASAMKPSPTVCPSRQ